MQSFEYCLVMFESESYGRRDEDRRFLGNGILVFLFYEEEEFGYQIVDYFFLDFI